MLFKLFPRQGSKSIDWFLQFTEGIYFCWDHRSDNSLRTDWSLVAARHFPRLPGAWGGNIHEYHRNCISEWLDTFTCCSFCREWFPGRDWSPPRPSRTPSACGPPPQEPLCVPPSFCPRVCSLSHISCLNTLIRVKTFCWVKISIRTSDVHHAFCN